MKLKNIKNLELVYDKHEPELKLKFSVEIDSRVHVAAENMLHVEHFYI